MSSKTIDENIVSGILKVIKNSAGIAARIKSRTQPSVVQQPIRTTDGKSSDNTWNRMVGIESGGKQFSKSGGTITSPKGAIGAAQIMPQFGSEFARRAGVDWDERKARTDKDYNLKLGRAQYDHLVNRYSGDTSRAAAAYNAGPGTLAKAERRAKAAGRPNEWRKYLPTETQNYVANAIREDVYTENYLTKTDVIDKAVARYGNTEKQLTVNEQFVALAESIPERHATMLTRLFTDLDENNQSIMVEMMEDEMGIRELLDFAIHKYMSIR